MRILALPLILGLASPPIAQARREPPPTFGAEVEIVNLRVYGRIADELRSLYSLGYISSNPRRDGKWRRIVVRVAGREDLSVRNKLGYYAPRDSPVTKAGLRRE